MIHIVAVTFNNLDNAWVDTHKGPTGHCPPPSVSHPRQAA